MRYDVRFELLLIDYLVTSLEGVILFDRDKENFDDEFSELYQAQNFRYSYDEILDRINRLEQFKVIEQTYFDNEKKKWKIELAIDYSLIDILGIDLVRETAFRTVEKLGVYTLSDIESLILHSFNLVLAEETEHSYLECINDPKRPYLNTRQPRSVGYNSVVDKIEQREQSFDTVASELKPEAIEFTE